MAMTTPITSRLGLFVVAAALAFPAAQAHAKEQTYFCTFTPHRQTGWIPEQAGYVIDTEAGRALANDVFIQYKHKKAIETDFKRASAKRVELKYTLANLPAKSPTGETTKLTLTYVMSLNIDTGAAKMRSTIHHATGYDGNTGTGSCQVVKNKR